MLDENLELEGVDEICCPIEYLDEIESCFYITASISAPLK